MGFVPYNTVGLHENCNFRNDCQHCKIRRNKGGHCNGIFRKDLII